MYLESCAELDHQLTQSVKRMAALAGNMSGGRWTVGVQEYRDGRKSLSFQLSDDAGFFLITSPIGKASELAMGKVRDRVRDVLADTRFEDMFGLPAVINPMEAAVAEAQGKLIEWKNSDRDYSRYYCDDASAYLTEYSDIGRDIMAPLLRLIDELIDDGTLDEAGVHENPVVAIGSMLAEAALEHARADLEYFDQDFRERAVDGINECAVARTIAEAVPAAKPAEEEPAQSRGPKH